jgi:hypothetical protein
VIGYLERMKIKYAVEEIYEHIWEYYENYARSSEH